MSSVLALVEASDRQVFARLLDARPPGWFRLWMRGASRLADGWLWLLLAAVLAWHGGRGLRVAVAIVAAAALGNAALVVAKRRVRRDRPCDRVPLPGFEVARPAWFPGDGFSFPSGHALNVFSAGTLVVLAFPWLVWPVLVVAASVAASRVVMGLHWLSDVVAGALAGVIIGGGVFLVLLR